MELTSIFQISYNQNISLSIVSERTLSGMAATFIWSHPPSFTTDTVEGTLIRYDGKEMILVHEGEELQVPSHLLRTKVTSSAIRTAVAWTVAKCIAEKKFSKAKPSRTISLIHTDEVKDWLSLVEASEALIAYWYRQRDHETELDLVDLSSGLDQKVASKVAIMSEFTVILKISPTTAHFVRLLRTLNPKAKLAIHGFESASVYFANTSLYGLDQFLFEEDLWLMSCEADKKLASYAWKKINAQVVPLRVPDLHKNTFRQNSQRDLLYFGRISEQKNLHEAIMGVALIADRFRSEKRKFKIYGYEDFLGVQNLRIPSLGYLEYLFDLTKRLEIQDIVEFHQPVTQNRISELLYDGIFISLSVHSDENFGLVAYRALEQGTPVLLSAWGGHLDLSKSFTDVELIPVYETDTGPKCRLDEISKSILKVLDQQSAPKKNKVSRFEVSSIQEPHTHMALSDLKIGILKKIENRFPWSPRKWPLYGQIFEDFNDSNYRLTLECYGARKAWQGGNTLSPLVTLDSKEIKVTDCSAGILSYPRSEEIKNKKLIQFGTTKLSHVTEDEYSWLSQKGYVF